MSQMKVQVKGIVICDYKLTRPVNILIAFCVIPSG